MSFWGLAKEVELGGPYRRSISLRVVLPSTMYWSTMLAFWSRRTSLPWLAQPAANSTLTSRQSVVRIVGPPSPASRLVATIACSGTIGDPLTSLDVGGGLADSATIRGSAHDELRPS